MRVLSVLTISYGLLFAMPAFGASSCGKMSVMSATDDSGQTIELVLDGASVEQTPAWSPGSGNPPLPVSRAVDVATAWARTHYARFDSVEIREISLTSLGCVGNKGRWYYVFEFVPIIDGNRVYGPGNWAAVLMDGSVIGATRASTSGG